MDLCKKRSEREQKIEKSNPAPGSSQSSLNEGKSGRETNFIQNSLTEKAIERNVMDY